MFVKPAPDPERPGQQLVVRFPAPSFALLPAAGGEVPETQHWLRRLLHGDVVRADPPRPASE